VNGVPEAITALVSVSAVWPSPIFDTVMVCVPDVPAATLLKPRPLVEKNTVGADTSISGVTLTKSVTMIGSSSTMPEGASVSVTVIASLSVTIAGGGGEVATPLPVSGMLVGLPASSVRKSEADSCPVVVDGVNVTVIVQLFPAAGKGAKGDDVEHVVVSVKSAKLGLAGAIPIAAKYSGTLPIFTKLMGGAATGTPSG